MRETELAELVRILVADASSEIAPDDSLVTLLWDARLEHVLYEEGDPFVEGDQADRIAFEKKRAEVLAGAALDTSDQLEDAWRAHGGKDPGDREEKRRALLGAVAGGSAASAAAQASNMRGGPATARPGGLTADQATRAVMEARLSTGASDVAERFTAAAAAAFVMAFRRGEPSLVTAALRTSVFGLDGDTAAADTLAFVSLLEAGVVRSATADEREPMVSALVNALVPPQRLDAIIAIGGAPDASQDVRGRFLRVVRRLDGTHVAALAAAVSTMDPSEVRDELLAYVAKHAPGHEGEIGSTLAKGHLEPSLALLKVLTRLGTPAARMAAQEATRSPHPIVRIEALGLVEGASGIGIRQALRAMLEDWDPAVRLAALRSIATYKVKVAGPGLVMRVKSPEFEKLPSEERREALHTLFALTGTRAEAVCLELLADTRLVAAEPHEQSRAIAAEMLGTHGRSSESRTALEAACHGRWKNTERVRVAATNALKAWDERAARPSQAPPPSSLGGDLAQWGQTESPPPMSRPPIAGRIATPPPIAGRIATPPPIAGRIATPPPIAGRITTPPPIAGRLAPPPASAAEIRQRSEAPAAGGRRSEVPPASRRPIDPRSDPPGELPPGVDGSGVGRVERTNRPRRRADDDAATTMTTGGANDTGVGFLARCVAGPSSSNAAVEAIRERGTEAVLAIYRLVKIGLIHSFENDAVGQTLDQTLAVLHEFAGLAGGRVTVTFADDTVFVAGQLLRDLARLRLCRRAGRAPFALRRVRAALRAGPVAGRSQGGRAGDRGVPARRGKTRHVC